VRFICKEWLNISDLVVKKLGAVNYIQDTVEELVKLGGAKIILGLQVVY